MTFSRAGSGLWIPRRHGLGATPGQLPIPPDAGTIRGGVQSAVNGYLPPDVASSARDQFRQQTGIDVPWVPTSPQQIGPWAKQQAAAYATPVIRQGISDGAKVFEKQMSGVVDGQLSKVEASLFPPMDESDVGNWVTAYVTKNGFPTTPDQGLAFARAFVSANCDQIGLPPEFIAAASLIQNFPDSVGAAEKWALNLGTAYLASYGIPIVSSTDVSEFLKASARSAIAQVAPGVPFQLFEATFSALKDGSLTSSEVKGLVISAAGFIGGVVGQAFGIPAPIGALLSQLVVGELVSVLSDAFGWGPSDSEKLNAAQEAATKAAAAASASCNTLATALWLEYQIYWESLQKNLDTVVTANAEWLFPQGHCDKTVGIRVFPGWSPWENTIDYVRNADGTLAVGRDGKPQAYPYPVSRQCALPEGCTYMSAAFHLVRRANYGFTPASLDATPVVSYEPMGCDALSALAFWRAQRYVTPDQVIYAMGGDPLRYVLDCAPGTTQTQFQSQNVRSVDCDVQPDSYYLKNRIGLVTTVDAAGTQLGQCGAIEWAAFMFKSLQQAAAASALVQRDIARTVSSATTLYGMQYHLESLAGVQWSVASDAQKTAAANAAVARAAAYRHAVIEARRKGTRTADLLNYGLLAAGGGTLLGIAAARMMRRR